MSRQDQFERILETLHEAALGDVAWTVPAGMINEAIRTLGTSLVIGQGCSHADSEIFFAESCYGSERRADQDERYFKAYYHRDERVPRALSLPEGELTPTGQLYTEREKKLSPAYNRASWRTKKNGLHVRLDGAGGAHILWILADSIERGGGWSSIQTEMIESLLPHVRHFARVRGVLADIGALGSSLEDLLDCGRSGVIQLDRRARIVAANDRARDLLREDGGLSDLGGFLNASIPGENDALQRLLARALPPHGVPASAGSMTIGRPDARVRLVVNITPVAEREWDLRAQRVAALVLIADPVSRPRLDAGLVAAALNLSPTESRLAIMMASGRTVRDIAAMTGRTEGTMRWHLKNVFRKTGISGQTDLVRRVLSLEGFPALDLRRRSTSRRNVVAGDSGESPPENHG